MKSVLADIRNEEARKNGGSGSFRDEARDRSRYMESEVKRISGERFAETGKEQQCALFVGNMHLEDFSDRRFRKAKAPVRTLEVDVNQADED
ncbi:hypothetical protein COY05_03985 [Candidatus Peregrinibacteria bacterium CG_4_10_14_0_2_um_filter_38_24]|nr:MAG: hypothetical protein COY05_03985 [Candidatus Peregrinibacteria bacterium CG_4_10_14_0_2_um_filter_38_24]PJC38707.1 MAG: hypothetical protein CO044_03530 [Candidatus Peregrinibacteria bacterium CG_4_9_14_0_2_um_filter_38_9]